MDGFANATLHFDRFTLDLVRGCLRDGDRDIHLRPKSFDVIRLLAENAGRLVSKDELLDTVWSGVVVSDDSLVQCIRELRLKLGDDGQRLIRTVPRRGYRLDSAGTQLPPDELSAVAKPVQRPARRWERRQWVIGASGLIVALLAGGWMAAGLVARPAEEPATNLFTDADSRQVAKIAAAKQLPVPVFRERAPSDDVLEQAQRLEGIWVSDAGWLSSGRQLMVIVTAVERDGIVVGYAVHGPAQPGSRFQSPPHVFSFRGQTMERGFSFDDEGGRYTVSLNAENRMQIEQTFIDGKMAWITLDPVWTLAEASGRPRI